MTSNMIFTSKFLLGDMNAVGIWIVDTQYHFVFFYVGTCAPLASHQKWWTARGQLVPFCCENICRTIYINLQNKMYSGFLSKVKLILRIVSMLVWSRNSTNECIFLDYFCISYMQFLACFSFTNKMVKEHSWSQNEDYVGGATCWSSNWLYSICKYNVIRSIEFTSQ